ncbi:MAG: YihY family inner membrane protein [Burkholderiaceae bacterium]|nr:YihY family inner membrane protein [Burkholderiaceae bacterium]
MLLTLKTLISQRLQTLRSKAAQYPWATTSQTLRQRLHEDNLGLTASSLTFTTVLALVPLITVALAAFTAFPMFGAAQEGLQNWLLQSLVPDSISRQVLGYLTQFSAKASQVGLVGFSALLATTLMLILTIDRTLNDIWRVPRLRPLGQRLFIYWTALTLGPLLLGMSLALTSYALSASRGLVDALPDGLRLAIGSVEFLGLAAGMAGLYHYVPNTLVKWQHAWAGGLFVAICMELAKKGLAFYLLNVPTYSVVYGAFATLPILLVWIYMAWTIVLWGAVVAAYLPSVLAGVARRTDHHGSTFELAIEGLQQLHRVRPTTAQGLRAGELAQRLHIDIQQLLPALEALVVLEWVGKLQNANADANEPGHDDPRYVLLAEPTTTLLAPLVQRLLLDRPASLEPLWRSTHLAGVCLADVLR